MRKTNSMYFENKQQALQFIDSLLKISLQDNLHYNDLHVYTEETAVIVEWEQIPYSHEWGGRFVYVDQDNGEEIMLHREYPDQHYEYFTTEKEWQEALAEWLTNNPGWKQTEYGRWYNELDIDK